MRKFCILLVFAFIIPITSKADGISLHTTCNAELGPNCATPSTEIYQFGMTVSFGSLTVQLLSPIATTVVEDLPSTYYSTFADGGGYVLLLDSTGQILADGTFLPGATSFTHPGTSNFTGSIQFFYLNQGYFGLGLTNRQGFGSFSWNEDVNLADALGATDWYDFSLGPNSPTPTPEGSTFVLLATALSLVGLIKLIGNPR